MKSSQWDILYVCLTPYLLFCRDICDCLVIVFIIFMYKVDFLKNK